jgi:hypothetical protein
MTGAGPGPNPPAHAGRARKAFGHNGAARTAVGAMLQKIRGPIRFGLSPDFYRSGPFFFERDDPPIFLDPRRSRAKPRPRGVLSPKCHTPCPRIATPPEVAVGCPKSATRGVPKRQRPFFATGGVPGLSRSVGVSRICNRGCPENATARISRKRSAPLPAPARGAPLPPARAGPAAPDPGPDSAPSLRARFLSLLNRPLPDIWKSLGDRDIRIDPGPLPDPITRGAPCGPLSIPGPSLPRQSGPAAIRAPLPLPARSAPLAPPCCPPEGPRCPIRARFSALTH